MPFRKSPSVADPGRVCVGVISGARGLRGDVRVKSFTARPEDVAAYGPVSDESGGRTFALTVTGRAGAHVIARIEGVADRTAAETLKGIRLYVARDALPAPDEDEYYLADLVGLAVERAGGEDGDAEPFGRVRAVHDFGGGDVVDIERPDGSSVMVPFTKACVPVVDIAGGRIVVDPPEGLLDGGAVGEEDGADPASAEASADGSAEARG